MNTKLVVVEGIPGSGKTTTAQFIADWYREHGIIPRLYLEGDWNHPADFESVACLDQAEYAAILARHPACEALLKQQVVVKGHDYFFSYRKLQQEYGQQLPEVLFTELATYEVYELPLEKYKRVILERWATFLSGQPASNEVFIFECCCLQNPLTTLVGRHNDDIAVATAYVMRLLALLEPWQPALIYLHPDDVHVTLDRVAQTRPAAWKHYLIEYLTGQGYGLAHGLQGFEGVSRFYALRQNVERNIFEALPWQKLLIHNADGNWPEHYETIRGFLASFALRGKDEGD